MDEHREESAWRELLELIGDYTLGPGEAGLDCLEGKADPPRVTSLADVRRHAQQWDFDLPAAVRSFREGNEKYGRDGLG